MTAPITYNGKKYIADSHVSDVYTVNRSWFERLFSLPWRPFQKTKIVEEARLHEFLPGIYLCSYKTYAKVVRELEAQDASK